MAIKHLWLPINGLEVIEVDLDQSLQEGYQVISSHVVSSEHGSNIHFVLWLKEDDLSDEQIPFTVNKNDRLTLFDRMPTEEEIYAAIDEAVELGYLTKVSPNGEIADSEPELSPLESFKAMIRSGDFVVLDTETTDIKGEICQIAIIDSDGGILMDRMVKPTVSISEDATRIHGIHDGTVKNNPTFREIADEIRGLLEGKNVVVHNAKFDRGRLHESADRHGMEKVEWKEISNWYCAMEMFAEVKGDWNDYHKSYRWHKLIDACNHYGIEVADAHDALGDCYMTLAVVKAMAGDKVLAD